MAFFKWRNARTIFYDWLPVLCHHAAAAALLLLPSYHLLIVLRCCKIEHAAPKTGSLPVPAVSHVSITARRHHKMIRARWWIAFCEWNTCCMLDPVVLLPLQCCGEDVVVRGDFHSFISHAGAPRMYAVWTKLVSRLIDGFYVQCTPGPQSVRVCVCVLSSGVVVIENTPKKCVRKRDSVHLFRIGCTCDGGCCCRFFAAGRKRKRRSPLGDLDKTATSWTEHNLYLPFWVARRGGAMKWEEEKERERDSLYASVTHLNLITSIRKAPLGPDIWDEKEKNRVTVRVSFPTRRFVFLPGNWGNR